MKRPMDERFQVGEIELETEADPNVVFCEVIDSTDGEVYSVVFERHKDERGFDACSMSIVSGGYLNLTQDEVDEALRIAGGTIHMERCRIANEPHFPPLSGKCWSCGGDMVKKDPLSFAFGSCVTGCRLCCKSYID